MIGVDGRAQLLIRLGEALDEKKEFFGVDGRPGNMIGTICLGVRPLVEAGEIASSADMSTRSHHGAPGDSSCCDAHRFHPCPLEHTDERPRPHLAS